MDGTVIGPFIKEHYDEIRQKILEGRFKPTPVRRVEIAKEEKGKFRKLGIPTVLDRTIQQAIAQVLSPIFEEQFSDNSFGFRPKRGAHGALRRCQEYVNDGYDYVVSMDLAQYFDTVNHSKLIEVLSRTIKDGRVISLIHKYLNAGVMVRGAFERTDLGVPQGGPLSPLLGNIMLNELDKELTRRGHRFVRYADDCIIFCKSARAAQRTLEHLIPYIEGKLFLRVNRQKTVVKKFSEVKYLGYAFYRHKGECRLRIHPKAVTRMKNKVRELTARGTMGYVKRKAALRAYIRGWVNYFALADMKKLLRDTDAWLRRRIRAIYWSNWKRVRTRYDRLRKLGLPEKYVHMVANCRKGRWEGSRIVACVLTNDRLKKWGYPTFTEFYEKAHENC